MNKNISACVVFLSLTLYLLVSCSENTTSTYCNPIDLQTEGATIVRKGLDKLGFTY